MNENLRNSQIAMGMESTFGTNSNAMDPTLDRTYRGPYQIGPEIQRKYNLSNSDLFDIDKARRVYMEEVQSATLNNEDWAKWDIGNRSNLLGIDQGLLEYMTWQQGRAGVINIITAASKGINPKTGQEFQEGLPKQAQGTLTDGWKERFLGQFNDADKELYKDFNNPVEFSQEYIRQQKIKWESYKRDSRSVLNTKDSDMIDLTMGEGEGIPGLSYK